MTQYYEALLQKAYTAFNKRDIDAVLLLMQPDVHWPNGWEGGYVHGYEEVRDYWTRQWQEVNPHVEPVAFTEITGNKVAIAVHQTVKDLQGNIVAESMVKHIYTFDEGKIKSMEIEKV